MSMFAGRGSCRDVGLRGSAAWLPVLVVSAALVLAHAPAASALVLPPPPKSTASDPRATFRTGNATTCAAAGIPSDHQLGSPTNSSAADENLTGTVKPNAGLTHPGQGEEVDVALNRGANAVVDAVVVKGGNGYNVYSAARHLPPTLPPDQHYISPFNGGGNVPTISHWFVCYHLADPPPVGSLTIFKTVIAPDGTPIAPLPARYTALVNCDDGIPEHHNVLVTYSAGGGDEPLELTGIPLGTVCTVREQGTPQLPPGTAVTYDPPRADTLGVTITDTAAVEVTITNDFSGIAVQTGSVELAKVVRNPAGAATPASFHAYVVCNDGITAGTVTLPGTGGAGTPVLHPKVGFDCTLEEVGVPAGWSVRYSLDGGAESATPPIFTITSGTRTVAITITNRAPTPTTTGPTVTTAPPGGSGGVGGGAFVPGPGDTGDAPPSGGLPLWPVLLGVAAAGLAASTPWARRSLWRRGRRTQGRASLGR